MSDSDLIERGSADINFRGLQDGTVNLILRNRFEEETNNFVPDLKGEFQTKVIELQHGNCRLQGMLNHRSGVTKKYTPLANPTGHVNVS